MSLYKNAVAAGVALLLLLVCSQTLAAGLGGIDLDSYLNQPLKARIQLLGVPADQIDTITARLASAGDYRVMGLDQKRLNTPLKFSSRVWRGKTVIEVTSARPINEPILQFAVDVTWQRGHLLKEYTLFLDPPTVAVAAPARQQKKSAIKESVPGKPVANTSKPAKPDTTRQQVRKPVSSARVRAVSSSEYGPVRAGETLWSIANRWREGTGATVNQAMVAIVRLNPRDFPGGNINRMNQGAILDLPSAEDIAAISKQEASSIVDSQISAWREQNTQTRVAPILAKQTTVRPSERSEAASESKINTAIADPEDGALARIKDDRLAALNKTENATEAKAEEPESKGLLELVPPVEEQLLDSEKAVAGSASGNDTRTVDSNIESRLTMAEEELVAAQEQNSNLSEQVASLQAEIASLREGLNLNDSELASMQQQLATDSGSDSNRGTKKSPPDETPQKSATNNDTNRLISNWWWLILLPLFALVGWFVYRSRRNESVESQVESNFLDAMLESKPEDQAVDSDPAVEEASLAADAERILALLDEDEAVVVDEFAAENLRQKSAADASALEDEKEEAEAIKKFLDKVDADKAAVAASSEDALDHTQDRSLNSGGNIDEEGDADTNQGSASEEIMASLESDDDSASDLDASNFSEDKIEVKLDLARAYLAMDDSSAAANILEEVLLTGSEQQQLEARSMLDEIDD